MQWTRGRNFLAIIVDGKANRAATHGVVPVAKRVRDGFAHGQPRVERFVNVLDAVRLKSACNGNRVVEETFGTPEQPEGIAIELAIVEEIGSVATPETRRAEEALRHLGIDPQRTPE